VRPLLPGSPGCVVLVTSRHRLSGLVAHDGARPLALDGLTADESTRLLTQIIGADRAGAEPAATAELARLCAGLPLALRIAAADLVTRPTQTIAGYADRLRAGSPLNALVGEGDERGALRAAFDLSYATQPAQPRRLFRLLGQVPGPDITVAAAAALVDAPVDTVGVWLERLAAAHLVSEPAPGRYLLHDLLRGYAREKALELDTAADQAAAVHRLLDHYLATADAAGRLNYQQAARLPARSGADPAGSAPNGSTPDGSVLDGSPSAGSSPRRAPRFAEPAQAATWLDAERANLVASVVHAAEHGPRSVAWQLADALFGYFYLRRYPVDWLVVVEAALRAATAESDLAGQAAALLGRGTLRWGQGRYRLAIADCERAIVLAAQVGWVDGQAAALIQLAVAHRLSGDLAAAADRLAEALELTNRTGPSAAAIRANLAIVQAELGRLAPAAEHLAEAVGVHQRSGDRQRAAVTMINLGEVLHALGDLERAGELLHEAHRTLSEIGDRAAQAYTLRCLAAVHRDTGALVRALEVAGKAIETARELGDQRLVTEVSNTIGTVHHRLGDQARAIEHHERALRAARQAGDRYPEIEAQLGLVAAYRDSGQQMAARTHAEDALATSRRCRYRALEGLTGTALASVALAEGDPRAAIDQAHQALAVHQETGHRLGQARTHVVLGHAYRLRYRGPDAERHWQAAIALFDTAGGAEAEPVRLLLQEASPTR